MQPLSYFNFFMCLHTHTHRADQYWNILILQILPNCDARWQNHWKLRWVKYFWKSGKDLHLTSPEHSAVKNWFNAVMMWSSGQIYRSKYYKGLIFFVCNTLTKSLSQVSAHFFHSIINPAEILRMLIKAKTGGSEWGIFSAPWDSPRREKTSYVGGKTKHELTGWRS